jgi:UDP-glucose 4-epimerase
VTVRPFNNFGPRQNDAGSLAAVIPLTVRRVLEGQAPVVEGDGLQTRDFTYVGDTIDALIRIIAVPTDPGALWNLGSGRETAIGTLVAETARLAGWTGEIERRPARAADVRRHCADVSRAEATIGPVAKTSLADGLRTTVEWYIARAQDDRA